MNRHEYSMLAKKFILPSENEFFQMELLEIIGTLKSAGFRFRYETSSAICDINVNVSAIHDDIDFVLNFKTKSFKNKSRGIGGKYSMIWKQSQEYKDLQELVAACA